MERNTGIIISCVPTIRPLLGFLSRLTKKKECVSPEKLNGNNNESNRGAVFQDKRQVVVSEQISDDSMDQISLSQKTRDDGGAYDGGIHFCEGKNPNIIVAEV